MAAEYKSKKQDRDAGKSDGKKSKTKRKARMAPPPPVVGSPTPSPVMAGPAAPLFGGGMGPGPTPGY